MAIALDAHTAAGVSTTGNPIATPQTFSHTTGSGSNRLLVVTIAMRGGAGGVITGVTYNGVSMTQVTTEALTGSAHATIYYLVNPASGSNTVSVAHSMTGSTHLVVSATSLTGVDQTTPLNVSSKASASSAGPMTTSLTTTVDDCWVVDSCAMRTQAGETATMTAATNRTSRTDSNTLAAGLRGLVSTLGPAGVAGSKTMEWTKTLNHDWAIMAAAFTPAASSISGTAAITESADTLSSASALAIAAVLASTEAGDTLSSAGALPLVGAAAVTEANDTISSAATLAIASTAAITEGGDSLSSASTIAIAAAASISETSDTLSSTSVIAIAAALAATEASDTLTSAGTVSSAGLNGAASITEADDSVSATARVAIAALCTGNEASDSLSATGAVQIKAQLAANDAGDTLVATGGLPIATETYPLAGDEQPFPGALATYPMTAEQTYPGPDSQTYPLHSVQQQYPLRA